MGRIIRFRGNTGAKSPANDDMALADRLAELLAQIVDEPLTVLPGSDPGDLRRETELRLSHFRPDLSERAAGLLEEAGW